MPETSPNDAHAVNSTQPVHVLRKKITKPQIKAERKSAATQKQGEQYIILYLTVPTGPLDQKQPKITSCKTKFLQSQ